MNVVNPKYSPEYLDSVQERFWELRNHTTPQLIDVLERNERRIPYEYEHQVDNALYEIEQEAILDADDRLLEYIFDDMSHGYSDKIQSGINYVIQNEGRGDLVIWSRLKDNAQWRGSAVWAPAFPENFNFILSSKNTNYLKSWDQTKILLVLCVNQTGQTDSLWRKKYKLSPKLVEIPSTSSMVMDWMMFQKEIDSIDFEKNIKNIS